MVCRVYARRQVRISETKVLRCHRSALCALVALVANKTLVALVSEVALESLRAL